MDTKSKDPKPSYIVLSHVLLCDPGCSPPGSSDHESSQARILEWVAISYSRGSSRPMDQPMSPAHISCIASGFFTTKPPGKHEHLIYIIESLGSDPAGLKAFRI